MASDRDDRDWLRQAGYDISPDPGLVENARNRPVGRAEDLHEAFGHPAHCLVIGGARPCERRLVEILFIHSCYQSLETPLGTVQVEPSLIGWRGVPVDPLFRLAVRLVDRRLYAFGDLTNLHHKAADSPNGLAGKIAVDPKTPLAN
jgi:hypothetical protein